MLIEGQQTIAASKHEHFVHDLHEIQIVVFAGTTPLESLHHRPDRPDDHILGRANDHYAHGYASQGDHLGEVKQR